MKLRVLSLCAVLGLTACQSSWVNVEMGATRTGSVQVDLFISDLADETATLEAWIGCGDRPTSVDQAMEVGTKVIDGAVVTFDADGMVYNLDGGPAKLITACDSQDFWVVYCTTITVAGRPSKVCSWGQGAPELTTQQIDLTGL